ncbi:Hypothetical predicted protein [Pelobates cultripes]|uniref:Uncharacterized protein n=1 Tax=Pelobates cultripes TaxID=61616 RepID=A0AAD1RE96_PELCU|nr:Hypothetical predicted protein [Pelobates cultripes]CAH2329452.1 Hypothetical predicted protein [Pelobates cultripes]
MVKGKINLNVDKLKKEIEERKRNKFQRDRTDYEMGNVYRWHNRDRVKNYPFKKKEVTTRKKARKMKHRVGGDSSNTEMENSQDSSLSFLERTPTSSRITSSEEGCDEVGAVTRNRTLPAIWDHKKMGPKRKKLQ